MSSVDEAISAEREACLTVMRATLSRLEAAALTEDGEVFALEARRQREAIESVRQGLHRMET